jgi:putative spermidine/putrescine transport system permease protein
MTDTTTSPPASPRRRMPWDSLAVAPFIIFAVMFLFLPTLYR